MIRTVVAPALLLLGLAACADTPRPMASSAPMTPPGEGPAFGASGNSQAPVTATTGQSGTRGTAPTARNSRGANPMDNSNSASARGGPVGNQAPVAMNSPGATPMDDSNSASARGGPGTGPVGNATRQPAQRSSRMAARRTGPMAPAGQDAAYMGGGMVVETPR